MSDKFKHMMIDLETMGTGSYSALRSIGAVKFNMDGTIGGGFYRNITLESCTEVGLKVNPRTAAWWAEQSDAARSALDQDQVPLTQALEEFLEFYDGQDVWGNDGRFDLGLLGDAMEAVNMREPWNHWQRRCLRTLVSLRPSIYKQYKQHSGIAHHALDDCHHQIKYAIATWQAMTAS